MFGHRVTSLIEDEEPSTGGAIVNGTDEGFSCLCILLERPSSYELGKVKGMYNVPLRFQRVLRLMQLWRNYRGKLLDFAKTYCMVGISRRRDSEKQSRIMEIQTWHVAEPEQYTRSLFTNLGR